MDANITKALNDKLYDKRKSGALELEGLIRDALAAQDHDRIARIVHQLCHEYAYAVHQPHARNGGLIGLAAASIALGPVRRYDIARKTEWNPDCIAGSSPLPGGNRASGACLFQRPRCPCPVLCLRKHVQHRQGCKRRDTRLL